MEGISLEFNVIPVGLLDLVSCRSRRYIPVPRIIKGRIKRKAEVQVRVALSPEKPPQSHSSRFVPTYETAERIRVTAVGPREDYCAHIMLFIRCDIYSQECCSYYCK